MLNILKGNRITLEEVYSSLNSEWKEYTRATDFWNIKWDIAVVADAVIVHGVNEGSSIFEVKITDQAVTLDAKHRGSDIAVLIYIKDFLVEKLKRS